MTEDQVRLIRLLNGDYIQTLNSMDYRAGHRLLHVFPSVRTQGIKEVARKRLIRLAGRIWNTENPVNQDEAVIMLPTKTADAKIALYTCVTGRYDSVQAPLYMSENIDYFCVSDIPVKCGYTWIDMRDCGWVPKTDQIRRARFIKTHPHLLFGDSYDYSIWIDGNCRPVNDLSVYLSFLDNTFFASVKHPTRDCLYREAKVCRFAGLDQKRTIDKQIAVYQNEGMPEHYGLFETNFIIRRHNNKDCIALMEEWWKEIEKGSRRDQLSLTYVMWKAGYTFEMFGKVPMRVSRNPDFRYNEHTEKRPITL